MKLYYTLTKPGIVLGNLMTAAAGFFLASGGHLDYGLGAAVLIGLALIMASASVFNNYLDRESDGKMERTKQRPLVKKAISTLHALLFAAGLGISGIGVLWAWTNWLALSIALAGFVIYVILYFILKRRSEHATLMGSLAGAVPPVVGYCAVTDRLDAGALILFLILLLWQMPHFFAIAVYRIDDYAAASIPVLPVKKGIEATKVQMLLYIVAFIATVPLLTLFHYAGYTYLIVVALFGMVWLGLGFRGFVNDNPQQWARKMFRFSLVTILVLCLMMAVDSY